MRLLFWGRLAVVLRQAAPKTAPRKDFTRSVGKELRQVRH